MEKNVSNFYELQKKLKGVNIEMLSQVLGILDATYDSIEKIEKDEKFNNNYKITTVNGSVFFIGEKFDFRMERHNNDAKMVLIVAPVDYRKEDVVRLYCEICTEDGIQILEFSPRPWLDYDFLKANSNTNNFMTENMLMRKYDSQIYEKMININNGNNFRMRFEDFAKKHGVERAKNISIPVERDPKGDPEYGGKIVNAVVIADHIYDLAVNKHYKKNR